MGKKSLLKSTSKKKAAPKKTTTKKTAAKKKAGVKRNPAKKAAPKKKAAAKKTAAKKKNETKTIKEPVVKKTSEVKPIADINEEKIMTDIEIDNKPEIEEIIPEEKINETIMEEDKKAEDTSSAINETADKVPEEETQKAVIQEKEEAIDTVIEKTEPVDKVSEEKTPEVMVQEEEDTTHDKTETDKEYKNEIAEPAVAEEIEEKKPLPELSVNEPLAEDSKTILPPDKTDHETVDSGKTPLIFGTALLVIIMILITGMSISNSKKYYMEYKNGAIKIFKGTFEPMGKSMLITLPGVEAPESTKAIYSKEEIYPIISRYYIEKAATLLEVPGMPDFKGVKTYLQKAIKFATSQQLMKEAEGRIKSIDFMILLYKADLMADTGSLSGLQDAIKYLKEAASMNPDKAEAEIIEKKIEAVQKLIDDAKKETAKKPEVLPDNSKK